MKQPHQDAFTSKQITLEIIKRLHIKCGFLDTEHLFMLPNNWLEYQEYADVNVYIKQNFYNTHCTKKSCFVETDFESWDSKIHGPCNYLLIFMWPLSLKNAGPRSIIHLQYFKMLFKKRWDHIIKARWTMELLCSILILKWHPRERKISDSHLEKRWRCFVNIF